MADPIAQVLSHEGSNTNFIWQHPVNDFNTGTQLIVHESQEAVFFMNGQALDSFGPGRHTLTTQNMPAVSKFFNRGTGDQTPFHCEVYFINKTEQMAIKWGTSSKMEYVEPTYGFPIQLGACGEMNLRIEDGRKLLIKVVGTERGLSQQGLVEKLRNFLQTKLKAYLVSYIMEKQINIFRIDEHLEILSGEMQNRLIDDFMDYGVSLERFFITTIVKPEDDKNYRRFKELHFRQYADIAEAKLRQQVGIIDQQTAAQRMVIEAEGIATKRKLEGYTYRDERGFDVAERMAANEAVGEFTNMGIGMGMISGIGGSVGNTVGGMVNTALDKTMAPAPPAANAEKLCSSCNAPLPPDAKFCLECGQKVVAPAPAAGAVCPQCGAAVSGGKFCPECGTPLKKTCPKCEKELAPGTKFCPECGEKI